jgi:hypothetical protein
MILGYHVERKNFDEHQFGFTRAVGIYLLKHLVQSQPLRLQEEDGVQ